MNVIKKHVMHVFGSAFRQGRKKNDPRALLNGPNRTKIENKKNAEILVNNVKVDFLGIKSDKTQSFLKITT